MEITVTVGFNKEALTTIGALTQALNGFEVKTSKEQPMPAKKTEKELKEETRKTLKKQAKQMAELNEEDEEEEEDESGSEEVDLDEDENEEEEEETEDEEEEEEELDAKTVLQAAKDFAKRNSREQLAKILKSFKVKSVSELPKNDYSKFMSKVQ